MVAEAVAVAVTVMVAVAGLGPLRQQDVAVAASLLPIQCTHAFI